jgi:FkbM family methyltransferase
MMGVADRLVHAWQKAPAGWRRALVSSPFAAILRKLLNRAYPSQPQVFELAAPLAGYKMWLHWQTQKAFVFGTFEPAVTREIERLVQPGWRVLDVGAHIGYHTLLMARCAGPHGKVIAFEPWPDNFQVLRDNVALNNCANVTLVSKAVMERAGRVNLGRIDADPLSSTVTTANEGGTDVEAVALDDFVKENLAGETVNFVKMDIEGAETAALEGMRAVLRSHATVLLIELHGCGADPQQHPAIEVLRQAGYSIQFVDAGGAQVHIVARPAGEKK